MRHEKEYLDLLQTIIRAGYQTPDRTGTGVLKLFNRPITADISGGKVPLITTKRVFWRTALVELLWMISGSTNVKPLQEKNCHIWDQWADNNGDLGPVYGKQLRNWSGIDQLKGVIESIKDDPYSRRHLISMWNVGELDQMRLAPCHFIYQFHVDNYQGLHLSVIQRSADMFLGVPFNLFNAAVLAHIVGYFTNTEPTSLFWLGTDCHIYSNHMYAIRKQLGRKVIKSRPYIEIASNVSDIDSLKLDHFTLYDYQHHPSIIAPVAI